MAHDLSDDLELVGGDYYFDDDFDDGFQTGSGGASGLQVWLRTLCLFFSKPYGPRRNFKTSQASLFAISNDFKILDSSSFQKGRVHQ